jgi:hypothetical protein
MRMWELCGIITIVLPGRIGSHILCSTITPVFDIEIRDRFALVIVAYNHSSLVCLVVNGLSSKHPLSLLSQSFKNVIWANFHDRDLLIKASFFTLLGSTALVLLDFSIATTWNFCGLKSHEFGVLHVWVALTTVFVTKGL